MLLLAAWLGAAAAPARDSRACLGAGFAEAEPPVPGTATFIDAEQALRERFGPDYAALPQDAIARTIVECAQALAEGGAMDLPDSVACGVLDFRRVANHVQITGGRDGRLVLARGQRGLQLLFCRLDLAIEEPAPREARPDGTVLADPKRILMFDGNTPPASEILGLFCDGSISIKQDVKDCAWIAGQNAFGIRTVTASARVDNCLFLWFGINWGFSEFNAHLDNPNFDWKKNVQMWLDCKGGGEGTRCYLMIETNYGNPSPGVVLENCKGLSLYHGSTERASSQGPGVYWLKNCENVQLGLRRIFAASRGGRRGALPTHDITIEGGKGNILHEIECFGNAQQETAVNSDPELQVWSGAFDFETQGFDDNLKFCFTPFINQPAGKELEKLRGELTNRTAKKIREENIQDTPENRKAVENLLLSGREEWWPLNATRETTFSWGKTDLTADGAALPGGRKLPPPPSMPATNAPRVRGPIAFTQAEGFGKALLDAGADPAGQKPSDEAFAKLLYGMTRDELQALLEESYKADGDFRAARKAKDKDGIKAAQARMNDVMLKLHPPPPPPAGQTPNPKQRLRRGRMEIPAGTFLLTRPLVLLGGWGTFWGAGPDKTVLKGQGDIKVIELHDNGTFANLTVEGGRVGIAITGQDHQDTTCPTLTSYLAGSNFYNLTFRNQTFAGMHIGRDNPELMGGAEHDQNRYVDMKFIRTGQYGIYMNQNMLDKWLLLHAEFVGQKKAGISVKFNNLIHGGIIGCTFSDIDGPGLDFMGGNPELCFRPHQVMVDQCEFLECGAEKEPAVDQGAGVCMSFTRCKVITKGKKILTGYRGGATIYEDVTVDVDTTGGPALLLRGARQNQTGRPNGHTLKNVKASGPVGFINDANAYNDFFRKTCLERGVNPNLNWDCDTAAHELAPPNGWVHPFAFYHCEFGGKKYAYSLLNVSTDKGTVLKEIDLAPLAAEGR